MSSVPADRNSTPRRPVGSRIAGVLSNAFWIGVIAFVSAAVFFLVLGAPAPWATRASTIIFGAVAVLFVLRMIYAHLRRREINDDPRFRRARERRGY